MEANSLLCIQLHLLEDNNPIHVHGLQKGETKMKPHVGLSYFICYPTLYECVFLIFKFFAT